MGNLLQIPPDGLVHVYQSVGTAPHTKEYIHQMIEGFQGVTPISKVATIAVAYEGSEAQIYFVPDPDLPLNNRARALAFDTFGWHMVFNGNVIIDGLTEEQVVNFVETLG